MKGVVLGCLLLAGCNNGMGQSTQTAAPPERPPVATESNTTDTQFWSGPVPGQPVDWHALPPLPVGEHLP